jgi:hypothetical protein
MKSFLKIQELPNPLETIEQQKLVKFVRYILARHGLERLFFSIPNEGMRNKRNASRLLCEGLMSGVPDLMLAVPANNYPGLFIEMKRQKTGKITDKQQIMHNLLKKQGYKVCVCYGFEEGKQAIFEYLAGTGLLPKSYEPKS